MLSQINPLDLGVISEFLWSAGPKNRSIVDDISAIRDLQGFSHIMVRYKNADLLGFQMVDELLYLEHRNRIDAREGLIQQDEFR